LFLELPELNLEPFPKMERLDYEGPISPQLINYFTKYSPNLEELKLKCPDSVLDPKCLKNLHIEPKQMLRRLVIEFTVATKGQIFIQEIKKIIECSENIKFIGNFGDWSNVLTSHIDQLLTFVTGNNLDLTIQK